MQSIKVALIELSFINKFSVIVSCMIFKLIIVVYCISQAQMKEKVEKIIENTVSLKISQMKIAKELGFDSCKEIYIKGETSVIIV